MEGFRTRLSRKRALAKALLGSPSGFFTQYSFAGTVDRIEFYPAIADLCREADLSPILAELDSEALATDAFFATNTNHLGVLDALVDYAIVRWAKPSKVIEIGSGRSTHVLSRAVADNGRGDIICIDPAPRLDIDDLPVTIHRRMLSIQDVELVAQLQANDVLFIDSSHILQPGTDCDIEFNLMFPALQPGVIVHVHDIFLPYAYPEDWKPRNWNEACGLAPWLLSGAFEIVFPTYYATRERGEVLYGAMPKIVQRKPYAGGSFWIRKR